MVPGTTIENDLVDISDDDLGLVADEDKRALKRLRDAIWTRECAVWVGAGISRELHGSWDDLVSGFEQRTDVSRKVGEREPEFFQRCKNQVGPEGYKKVLEDLFSPANHGQQALDNHYQLVFAGFTSYVTTNFDLCLEKAVAVHPKLIAHYHSWPESMPHGGLLAYDQRRLYHMHGVQSNTHPYGLLCGFPNVVLASDEYTRAYEGDEGLVSFLKCLLAEVSVLFCGCSLNVDEKEKELQEVLESFVKAQERKAQILGELGGESSPREHYILRHCQAVRTQAGVKVQREAAARARREALDQFQRFLPHFSLSPILYAEGEGEQGENQNGEVDVTGETHYYLNQILRHLAKEASYEKIRGER